MNHAGTLGRLEDLQVSGEGNTDTSTDHQHRLATSPRQLDLLGHRPAPQFDGPGIEEPDRVRFSGQLARVAAEMADGEPRTLRAIADAARCSEASASARLRDLRKARFGAHRVERQRDVARPGVWLYRVAPEGGRR